MGSPGSEPTAVRLVLEYRDDELRLVTQVPVDIVMPGQPPAATPGAHVAGRTPVGTVIGRAAVRPAMTTSLEVYPEDPADPIVRTDLPEASGAFTVVVPVPPDADHVTVVRVPDAD